MKTKYLFLSLVAGLMACLTSCQHDNLEVQPQAFEKGEISRSVSGANRILVLSEGNMTNENGTLAEIIWEEDQLQVTDSIYQKRNPGRKLGNVAQDLYILGDTMYIICQNGHVQGGDSSLVVMNANTYERIRSIGKGFGTAYGSSPTHFAVVSHQKAYVRCDNGLKIAYLQGANQGLQPEVLISDAAKTKLAVIDGMVYAARVNSVARINPGDDAVSDIAINQGAIASIVRGSGNTLWVFSIQNSTTGILTQLNTATNAKTHYTIKCSNGDLDESLFIPSVGLCCYTGDANDILYFRGNGWEPQYVYKVQPTEASQTINAEVYYTANLSKHNVGMIYGDLGVDPQTGFVYFGYVKSFTSYRTNGIIELRGTSENDILNYNGDDAPRIDTRFTAGIYFPELFENR